MSTETTNKQKIEEEAAVENQDGIGMETEENGADIRTDEVGDTVVTIQADKEKVEKTIRGSVYASMGIGIVPLPIFNVAAVTASNINLVRNLSGLYGVEFKEGAAKKLIAAVTGAGMGVLASPLVESAVIGIPLIGLPLAIGTKPALNGMTTYALGRMFVTHFERGGNFIGANIDSMKEDFASAFQNSREWLGSAISGTKAEKAESR